MTEFDFDFEIPATVYGQDIGIGGVTDPASCLRFMDRGRVDAIEELCSSVTQNSWLDRFLVNVYRMDASFGRGAKLGEKLRILSGIYQRSSHRISFNHRLVRPSDPTVVADATVEVLFLDRDGELVAVPDDISEHIEQSDQTLVPFFRKFTPLRKAPESPFVSQFRIYYEDTDAQGIAYHVTYGRFCERAIMDILISHNPDRPLADLIAQAGLRISKTTVQYLSSCRIGEVLEVSTHVLSKTTSTLVVEHRLRSSTSPDKLSARALTEIIFEKEGILDLPIAVK